MEFRPALDLVIDALERMRSTQDRWPRASLSTLREFQDIAPSEARAESNDPALSETASRPAERPRVAAATSKRAQLDAIAERVRVCVTCAHLAVSRTQPVFGVGDPDAEIMFVGEAPGADEDKQGEPFVGRAGQLLTKIIAAMGFNREDVYIANVLKCRPDTPGATSGNRPPTLAEMQTCLPYLREQIDVVQPRVVVALGATAVEGLLGFRGKMGELRGTWRDYHGTPLMITYHPSYLLRNQAPSEKRKVWEDMLAVLEKIERPISEKQRNYFR